MTRRPVPSPHAHDVTPPRCSGCDAAVPPGRRSCRCTAALDRFPIGGPVAFHHGRRTSVGHVVGLRIADGIGPQVAVEWVGGPDVDGLWLDTAFVVPIRPCTPEDVERAVETVNDAAAADALRAAPTDGLVH